MMDNGMRDVVGDAETVLIQTVGPLLRELVSQLAGGLAEGLSHELCAREGRPPMGDFLAGCDRIAGAVRDAGDSIARAIRAGLGGADEGGVAGALAGPESLTEGLEGIRDALYDDPRRDI